MCLATTVMTLSLSLASSKADVRPTTPALEKKIRNNGQSLVNSFHGGIFKLFHLPYHDNIRHLATEMES